MKNSRNIKRGSSTIPTSQVNERGSSGGDGYAESDNITPLDDVYDDEMMSLMADQERLNLGLQSRSASLSSIRLEDLGYSHIKDGKRFFKVGRVFAMLWTDPVGKSSIGLTDHQKSFITQTPAYGETLYTKERRFVVFSEQKGSCICIRLSTYGGQGASKKGVNPSNHAAVYAEGDTPKFHPGEKMDKEPFPIIVENEQVKIAPMSRLNFGHIQTIQHNVKVLKIGRIPKSHHKRLIDHAVESMAGSTFIYKTTPSLDTSARSESSYNPASGKETSQPAYNLYPDGYDAQKSNTSYQYANDAPSPTYYNVSPSSYTTTAMPYQATSYTNYTHTPVTYNANVQVSPQSPNQTGYYFSTPTATPENQTPTHSGSDWYTYKRSPSLPNYLSTPGISQQPQERSQSPTRWMTNTTSSISEEQTQEATSNIPSKPRKANTVSEPIHYSAQDTYFAPSRLQ